MRKVKAEETSSPLTRLGLISVCHIITFDTTSFTISVSDLERKGDTTNPQTNPSNNPTDQKLCYFIACRL